MTVLVVRLKDGGTLTGEYVGAMDGYLYLLANGEIIRLQRATVDSYEEAP